MSSRKKTRVFENSEAIRSFIHWLVSCMTSAEVFQSSNPRRGSVPVDEAIRLMVNRFQEIENNCGYYLDDHGPFQMVKARALMRF